MAEAPLLQMRGMTKSFAGVPALIDVDMNVHPGEVRALIGQNGAGKSTLIKLLTGVYRRDSGEVEFDGHTVDFASTQDAQRAGVATIYQEVNLIPYRSVAENVCIGRAPRRFGLLDWKAINAEARQRLRELDVEVDVTRPLFEFPIATQQMTAIARALSFDARLVIMDEPTSSLEPREVDRLASVIELLRADGVAVLYVTHKLDEVMRLCQQVTVLRDGRRVHTGPVARTSRIGLVATMLGRRIDEVREHGMTRFGEGHGGTGGEPVLRATSLTRPPVLAGVSVDVHAGEVVGLAGLLGSGRTETARAVFGADPVDSGAVSVDGVRRRRWSPAAAIAAGVALVPEDRKAEGVIPDLSVRDNIVLAALPRLTRAGFVTERRCREIVEVFVRRLRIKIAGPDQRVRDLSGGNQQKVLLARMLCLQPKVLLLDEPTRGIDVGAKAEIQALIDELASQGLGVVLISSELEEIIEGSDRVLVLRDGAVVGVLTGDAISENRIMTTIAAASDETERAVTVDG
jgi:galactofuranose transport system ATP-binding protein